MKSRVQQAKLLLCLVVVGLFFAILFLTPGIPRSAQTAPGDLDASFGGGAGTVTTPISTLDDRAYALAIQPDGKLVTAGYSFNGSQYEFALVRYNTDGSLDTTFGTGGIVTTAIGTVDDRANAMAIQSDGKLVAAGYTYNGSQYEFALVRYNADGSLDTAFGAGGIVTTAIGTVDDRANALAIQSDGKLVAAGYSADEGRPIFGLVRYNTDGSRDNTFGTMGFVTTDTGAIGAYAKINSLAIQADGKLVAAGVALGSGDYDFALVRYNMDGSLDAAFGTNGIVTTDFAHNDDDGKTLIIQPDGKLVVAGYSFIQTQRKFPLVRYNTDGSLDATFGTGGIVTTAIGTSDARVRSLAIQSDGKLVAAGFFYDGNQFEFGLARYNTDGSLDATFGVIHPGTAGGTVTTAIGTVDDEINALAIQPDGKLVVAGFTNTGTQYEFALARYWGDPTAMTTTPSTTTTTATEETTSTTSTTATTTTTTVTTSTTTTITTTSTTTSTITTSTTSTTTRPTATTTTTTTTTVRSTTTTTRPTTTTTLPLFGISGFLPEKGPLGTIVMISGTGFKGSTAVQFNGAPVEKFTVLNSNRIRATVPAAACPSTGTVSVSKPGGTATSGINFTCGATINGFTPIKGPAGTLVTISGRGFTKDSSVQFSGIPAVSITFLNSNRIRATVPADVCPGPGPVSVITPSGPAASAGDFNCAATVSGFTPSHGPAGTLVTISGTGFTNASSVRFNGIPAASTTFLNSNRIRATVPAGATDPTGSCLSTGTISVNTPSGLAASAASFTCAATVSGFTPSHGPGGTLVTISGTGFTSDSSVQFSGVPAAAFTFLSPSRVRGTVPAGAVTGTISVSTPSGAATSMKSFSIP